MGEFVRAAAVGTHIAHFDAPWILGVGPFDPADYGFTKDNLPPLPDLTIDPESKMLTVINLSKTFKSYHIGVDAPCIDQSGQRMALTSYKD